MKTYEEIQREVEELKDELDKRTIERDSWRFQCEILNDALKPIKDLMAYNEERHGRNPDGDIRIPLNVMLRKKVRQLWYEIGGENK